jgi:hypothetical protein
MAASRGADRNGASASLMSADVTSVEYDRFTHAGRPNGNR